MFDREPEEARHLPQAGAGFFYVTKRRDLHEQCQNEIRALQKRIADLEEEQRRNAERDRELLAVIELMRRVILRR